MAVDELHCPHPGVEDEGDGDTVGDLGDVIDSKSINVTVVVMRIQQQILILH